jgi:RNA polymerase sigma-70 factor (ECF subfamily)
LHEATYPDLLRFVERRLPGGEAEDVVSAVFEVAWRRLDDVPHEARAWLFGIARGVMANHVRGASRRADLEVRLLQEQATWGSRQGSNHEIQEQVAARLDLIRAWQVLGASEREVLALVAFDGLSNNEAAQVLGCGRSAFAMRLARARRRLRQAMENPPTTETGKVLLWDRT